MKESFIQRAIMDWLSAKHVLAYRMNVGASFQQNANGGQRFMRFGTPGMADILAFPQKKYPIPVWIEVKAEKGKQSFMQQSFQAHVEANGYVYLLARSVDDVERAFQVVLGI